MPVQGTLIKRKLRLAILLASLAVLLLTTAAFVLYEFFASRHELRNQVGALARVVAFNSSAAIVYQNEQEAIRTLESLRAAEHITLSALYDSKGKLYVRVPTNSPLSGFPVRLQADGPR